MEKEEKISCVAPLNLDQTEGSSKRSTNMNPVESIFDSNKKTKIIFKVDSRFSDQELIQ